MARVAYIYGDPTTLTIFLLLSLFPFQQNQNNHINVVTFCDTFMDKRYHDRCDLLSDIFSEVFLGGWNDVEIYDKMEYVINIDKLISFLRLRFHVKLYLVESRN